jgi:hypothetical protein
MQASTAAARPDDFATGLPLDEDSLARCPADAFVVVRLGTATVARAALYWLRTPALEGKRTGFIGHFWAATADATRAVLDEACRALREAGAAVAVGPINGSTWEKYRFVTGGDGSPPFLLEPTNPPEWPGWWEAAGFAKLARYTSRVRDDLTQHDELGPKAWAPLAARGVRLVHVGPEEIESALHRVFPLVSDAFSTAFLYAPVTEEAFVAQYIGVKAILDPRFCVLAEQDGEVLAFLLSHPDRAEQAQTGRLRTIVNKTIAARPGNRIANVLFHEIDRAAREAGAERVINALMFEKAHTTTMLGGYGRLLREYAIWSRGLGSG